MTKQEAIDVRQRDAQLRAWMGKRNSYHPSELPESIGPPTNEERSKAEAFEFCDNPPESYFAYVKIQDWQKPMGCQTTDPFSVVVTTWMGDILGRGRLGHVYRDNFGGKRQSIRFRGINGCDYAGTYFTSAGDYCRVKKVKRA